MKKFGGKLEHWARIEISGLTQDELNQVYGPNLGFIVRGRLGTDHKERGFDNRSIQTSLVVKFSDTQIETLNTIYDLGQPYEEVGATDRQTDLVYT